MPRLGEAASVLRVPESILRRYVDQFAEFFRQPAEDLSFRELAFLEIIRDGKASELTTEHEIRARLTAMSGLVPHRALRPAAAPDPDDRPVTRDDMVALIGCLAGVIRDLKDEVQSLRRQLLPVPVEPERPARLLPRTPLPAGRSWFRGVWLKLARVAPRW